MRTYYSNLPMEIMLDEEYVIMYVYMQNRVRHVIYLLGH